MIAGRPMADVHRAFGSLGAAWRPVSGEDVHALDADPVRGRLGSGGLRFLSVLTAVADAVDVYISPWNAVYVDGKAQSFAK